MRGCSTMLMFCLALAGVCANPASAQPAPIAAQSPDDADARRAFEAGRDAYDHGAFAEALTHYERAYVLSHRPGLLFNIARAADSDGRADRDWDQASPDRPRARGGGRASSRRR